MELHELEAELLALAGDRHASKHRMLHLLGRYDDTGGWARHGATTCAAWWAEVCGIEVSTAREQLRVARALMELPALDEALADGRLSYAKAKVISRHATPATIDELIELAEPCPAGRLGVALAAWRSARERPDAIAAAQHEARSLSWRTEPDGMITLTARFRPIDGGGVTALIDAAVMRADHPAGPTLAQQRLDALLALLAGGGSTRAEVQANVHVHVSRAADGTLVAALPDGTPVPEPQLAEILCEATVRALVHDADGKPIDASPGRRTPTGRQMTVLRARDTTCTHAGCRARTFLHAHHVIHREHGGPTVLTNLRLLCNHHHREEHAGHERPGPHR